MYKVSSSVLRNKVKLNVQGQFECFMKRSGVKYTKSVRVFYETQWSKIYNVSSSVL